MSVTAATRVGGAPASRAWTTASSARPLHAPQSRKHFFMRDSRVRRGNGSHFPTSAAIQGGGPKLRPYVIRCWRRRLEGVQERHQQRLVACREQFVFRDHTGGLPGVAKDRFLTCERQTVVHQTVARPQSPQ